MPPLAILDIGPMELLLLAAAAVLLFGGDLPSAARKAARWVARARATLAELRSELDAGTRDLPEIKPPEELIRARDELTAHARRTRDAIREAHALAVAGEEHEDAPAGEAESGDEASDPPGDETGEVARASGSSEPRGPAASGGSPGTTTEPGPSSPAVDAGAQAAPDRRAEPGTSPGPGPARLPAEATGSERTPASPDPPRPAPPPDEEAAAPDRRD